MLNRYKVTYEDLFEGVDSLTFLQQLNNVRNDLIHRGYSPLEKLRNYSVKLSSLVVRIILSIIEYDGYYWEQKKVEFSNPPQYNIYDRKHIPFKKKMTVQEETIAKIRKLPEPLIQQVNDYIEFLLMKNDSKRAALWIQFNEALEIAESDFADYLPNLEDYEERLARGEIQW
jgi:hypothetical protein